jgi:hypothetical protein
MAKTRSHATRGKKNNSDTIGDSDASNGEGGVQAETSQPTPKKRQYGRGKRNAPASADADTVDGSESARIKNAGFVEMSEDTPRIDKRTTSTSIPDPKPKERTVAAKPSKTMQGKTPVSVAAPTAPEDLNTMPVHTDTNALQMSDSHGLSRVADNNATPTQPKRTFRPETATVTGGSVQGPSAGASRPTIRLITQRGSSGKVCISIFSIFDKLAYDLCVQDTPAGRSTVTSDSDTLVRYSYSCT